jgi:protein-tyrosine-phosphatase
MPTEVARNFEMLAGDSQHLLREAIRAFNESNPELARATKQTGLREHMTYDKVYEDLLREGEKVPRPLKELFVLQFAFRRLARIRDRAKNLCEETLFAATGEAKEPKVFRVLFLDERNDMMSLMAEAIARKGFPTSGHYESAGWKPAESARADVLSFLDRHGHDTSKLAPRSLVVTPWELGTYHVIVSLEGDARERLPDTPFYTTLLEWEIDKTPQKADGQLEELQLEGIYGELSLRIRELMRTLRGSAAN